MKIIKQASNTVFMTIDEQGFPHPRTMWVAGFDDDFTTYYVTGKSLVKCKHISENPKVCSFWTQVEGTEIGPSYAFVKGVAEITEDQSLRDRFWNDMLSTYFPEGKTDPNYIIIIVRPKELMLMDEEKYPLDKIEF